MKKMIRLERPGELHGQCFWECHVDGNKVRYEWGYIGGKTQTEEITFSEGKNIGRANETTPEQQCLLEAEKKARKKLEGKYELVEGELSVERKEYIEPDKDVPLPMLAKKYADQKAKVKGTIYLQAKLNGNRCLVNRKTGQMYSRTRKEIEHLPFIGEAVIEATKSLSKDIVWVDGELFAIGLSFNDIQTIIRRRKNVDEKLASRMRYHIFDVISDKPWSERRDIVADIKPNKIIKIVPDIKVDASKLKENHDIFVKEGGFEGAIIRLDGKGYENKRSSYLIKYKEFIDAEYKVVSFNCEKHHDDLLGSATLEMKDGKTFEARPAMNEEEKAYIWKNRKDYIGKKATIKYQQLDDKTGIPIFGVLIAFRDESDLPDEKEEE